MKKKKPILPKAEKTTTILEQIKPEFVEAGARKITPLHVEELFPYLSEALEQFAADGPLERHLREAKLMVSLIADYRDGDNRSVPFWTIAVVSFALGYVLKPIDIIPDTLPVIGQLDDAVVVALCIDLIRDDLERYRAALSASKVTSS